MLLVKHTTAQHHRLHCECAAWVSVHSGSSAQVIDILLDDTAPLQLCDVVVGCSGVLLCCATVLELPHVDGATAYTEGDAVQWLVQELQH